jgi:hypothetical protein
MVPTIQEVMVAEVVPVVVEHIQHQVVDQQRHLLMD